jgi:hypothetical protein
MIGEVAVSGGFLLTKIFSSRISSDANHLGRALSVPAASGGVLILVGDSVYWRLRAVELGDDDDVVFPLARILKQSNRYVALGWAASGLRWPASAGAVLGCDEEVSLVSPPLSVFYFLFYFLFLYSDLNLLFEFKLISGFFCRF